MLIMQAAQAKAPRRTVEAFDRFLGSLPETYRPLLGPTRTLQAEILGIQQPERSPEPPLSSPYYEPRSAVAIRQEILSDGSNLFVVRLTESRRRGVVGRTGRVTITTSERQEPESELDVELFQFSAAPDEDSFHAFGSLLESACEVQLKSLSYSSERFGDLVKEGRRPPESPSAAELVAARLLEEKATRSVAIAIKASGGLLVSDLPKALPGNAKDQATKIREGLLRAGMVSSELVVVCSKTSVQVTRMASKSVLADLARQGVKCGCGRSLADERIEEALSITELGISLLDGSRWLLLLVLDALTRLGIRLDDVLINQQIGGDEMDCIANISGELTLFELKDKEFNLREAYSFGAKQTLIRPQHSVIVTTEVVGNDTKEHFRRAGVGRRRGRQPDFYVDEDEELEDLTYIEGLANLHSGLADLATRIYRRDAQRVVAMVIESPPLGPSALLHAVRPRPAHQAEALQPVANGHRSKARIEH